MFTRKSLSLIILIAVIFILGASSVFALDANVSDLTEIFSLQLAPGWRASPSAASLGLINGEAGEASDVAFLWFYPHAGPDTVGEEQLMLLELVMNAPQDSPLGLVRRCMAGLMAQAQTASSGNTPGQNPATGMQETVCSAIESHEIQIGDSTRVALDMDFPAVHFRARLYGFSQGDTLIAIAHLMNTDRSPILDQESMSAMLNTVATDAAMLDLTRQESRRVLTGSWWPAEQEIVPAFDYLELFPNGTYSFHEKPGTVTTRTSSNESTSLDFLGKKYDGYYSVFTGSLYLYTYEGTQAVALTTRGVSKNSVTGKFLIDEMQRPEIVA